MRLSTSLRPLVNAAQEAVLFARMAADVLSAIRFSLDALAYRALRFAPRSGLGRRRHVRLKGGVVLAYRCNRGDIQTLREVWLDEIYRLPLDFDPRLVLDLGANIGFSAVWFAKTYGSRVVAVEPLSENVDIAKENVALNNVEVEVIQAAVGATPGIGRFEVGAEPNLGRLGTSGREVRVVGIESLMQDVGHVDLVKLDIEGGEESLLADPAWLDACDSLIIEFHPTEVDYDGLVDVIVERGFDFYRGGSILPKTADFFLRRPT